MITDIAQGRKREEVLVTASVPAHGKVLWELREDNDIGKKSEEPLVTALVPSHGSSKDKVNEGREDEVDILYLE